MIQIAKYLTGFPAVVWGLLLFVGYRLFEVQALFYRYLPLGNESKLLASILVAVVLVFALLIFSANLGYFKLHKYDSGDWIKRALFIFTIVVNCFFWEVWEWQHSSLPPYLTIGFKAILCLYMGIFDYAFNHLFISKWKERVEYDQTINSLETVKIKLDELVQEKELMLAKKEQEQLKLRQLIAEDHNLLCPYCFNHFDTVAARNGHIRTCTSHVR